MITFFSAILGFLGAMAPEALALFRDRADRRHELLLLEMQLKQQAAGGSQRLEEIHMQAAAAQSQALYRTYRAGIPWVDALNATVRPVLAYAFFLLYATVKSLQFTALDPALPWTAAALWGEEDQAIFAGIISFYFGQRAFGTMRQ